jgi:hypothetical protein
VPGNSGYRIYSGAINETINIEMRLRRFGNTLSGSYFYAKYRIPITLTGTVNPDQSFRIDGFDGDGTHIDAFDGYFFAGGTMQGNWSKPDGSRVLPFSLTEIR